MNNDCVPSNLTRLHAGEESLRQKAVEVVASRADLQLHLKAVESAMELADQLRQHGSDDEDSKVIRVLGMRCFNSLASATKRPHPNRSAIHNLIKDCRVTPKVCA